MAELYWDAVRVESVNRVNKAMVDHIGHMDPSCGKFVLYLPEIFFAFYSKGNMVEYKGPSDWFAVIFLLDRFDTWPLEKSDQIVLFILSNF